jgi:DnaJ-class molecular chaperone
MTKPGSPQETQLTAFANRIGPVLDRMNYYQLLNVAPTADIPTIRGSFYQAAAQLHPDRYHGFADGPTKTTLETIYARICEGYRVLTTGPKRAMYDKGLPEGKVRFDSTDRESQGPRNPEDALTHPEAKKFFRLATICMGKNDWKGAAMNFNFARTFEPSAKILIDKLAEAQAAQKTAGASVAGIPKTSR